MTRSIAKKNSPPTANTKKSFMAGIRTMDQHVIPPIMESSETLSDQAPMHILIIDDDEVNNYMLSRSIHALNQDVTFSIAENGVDALIDLGKLNTENASFPDFILVDLDMPYMDGFEFLSYYEKDFYESHQETVLIVVTSSPLKVDQDRAIQFTSVSQFVNKPFPLSIIS